MSGEVVGFDQPSQFMAAIEYLAVDLIAIHQLTSHLDFLINRLLS